MIDVESKDLNPGQAHAYLLGGVAPRPIALVSTLSEKGVPNLAPFSFFNAFGANPPTVAFSASRRIRDNSNKDTLSNLVDTKECVIQAVTYAMVQQISLASSDFAEDVDEFAKSGLTPVASDLVKPSRVSESPFQLECRLQQVVSLGDGPGSGNLAICEVLKFHIDEGIFDGGVVHPDRIDLVARMGADFYVRASGSAVFTVAKPGSVVGIGFDQLPRIVRESSVLTGNQLAQLAGVERIPVDGDVAAFRHEFSSIEYDEKAFGRFEEKNDYESMFRMTLSFDTIASDKIAPIIIRTVIQALIAGKVEFAWKVLLLLKNEDHQTGDS
jgi:flavin reductase (DIM6/NTAB) family NADH-FMN oxidoreductase RutF